MATPKKMSANVVKSHVNFPMLNAVETPARPNKTRTTGPTQQSEAITTPIPPAHNSFLSSFFISYVPLLLGIYGRHNHKKHNSFFLLIWFCRIFHTCRKLGMKM